MPHYLPVQGPISCVFVSNPVPVPDVLAHRYASDEMVAIWSPEAKIVAERRLWLAVLADMGVSLLVVANGLRLRRWTGQEA